MPTGQKVALERLVDATRAANKKAVLFLCRHEIEDTEKDVDAAKAIVKSFISMGNGTKGTEEI